MTTTVTTSAEKGAASGARAYAKLPLREKISYGFGDFGNGFMFDLGQAYLLKYYTDVVGLPSSVAGGVFIFTKIFDAFMDPIAGAFIDGRRTVGRHGRFRRVMFTSSIGLAILTLITFTTPHASFHVNLVYAYATYMAWGLLYSFTNVPYGSLASVMTQDSEERAQLASFRQAGSVGSLLIVGVAFMPIVLAVGHQRLGFALAAGVMALAGVVAFGITARGTRERVPVARPQEKLTIGEFLRTVVTNRPLLVVILMTVFSISAYNIKTAMVVYFTQYYLGNVRLLAFVNFISIGASVIGILAMPWLVRRMGKKRTAILGFLIAAAADGLNFLLPSNLWLFTVLLSISFIGVAIPNGITWALVSDAIDHGHWHTGTRREGITYSAFNFSRKIAQSIAGGLAGYGLTMIHYVPNAHQAASTLHGIKVLQTGYPAVAFAIAAAVIGFLYPLSDKRHAEIVAEIHDREAAREVVEDAAVARELGLTDPTTD